MSAATRKHNDWVAWRVSDDEVRVQINRPDMARAFAKVKTAWLAGYSVAGNYTKIFHIKQSVPWVDDWMKSFISYANGVVRRSETK